MALIPLEHERKLASPAEAEALFRALGEPIVTASGFHTTDAGRIATLVGAVGTRDNTVSFEGGTLDPGALDAYAHTVGYQYLDVRTAAANLRTWPELYSWVEVPGSETITFAKGELAAALRAFHAVAVPAIVHGFSALVRAKHELTAFLVAAGARVHADLELDLAGARALGEQFVGDRYGWEAGGVIVRFPDGAISGFAKLAKLEQDKQEWFARIANALAQL